MFLKCLIQAESLRYIFSDTVHSSHIIRHIDLQEIHKCTNKSNNGCVKVALPFYLLSTAVQ